jgi:hypothetical protein
VSYGEQKEGVQRDGKGLPKGGKFENRKKPLPPKPYILLSSWMNPFRKNATLFGNSTEAAES